MSEPEVVPVAPDMVVSETLGGYELLRRLGSGGMAEVHLARVPGIQGFQKLVVLKQILPHLSRDKHFVRMFLEEARVAALLDHPNVVQVFDLGKDEGEFFFTMEFVYGENLQGLLKGLQKVGQTLAVEHVVTVGIAVAAGLHCAHERVGFDGHPLGIVHRDVSPTNVMITYEGCVKVADFGIAKVVTRTDVTRAGTRKGKVPYMSPEQCRAEKIDRRSDVFSLGIVLWEAVTGQRLFEGDNEFGVMNLIVNGHMRPPSAVKPDIPKELERIIMKALTVNREQRYQTTRELQIDLEAFARELKLRATASALGELMHYLFRPQPFPWGALRGSSGKAVMSPATIAEISKMIGTHGGALGTGAGRFPSEVTSGAGSYASQVHGPLPTGASIGSLGTSMGTSMGKAKPLDPRAKTLRAVAIGLGSAAALALVMVLGLWLGGRGAAEETAEAKQAAAAAAEQLAAAQAAAARAAEPMPTPTPAPAPVAAPVEPAVVPVPAEPTPAVEPVVEPAAADAAVEPVEGADAGAEEPAEPEVAEPEVAEPEEIEPEVILEDDEPTPTPTPKTSGTKPTTSKTTKPKTKKKKPDLDAFMPGFGG
jgi:serine/threonine protein kinase